MSPERAEQILQEYDALRDVAGDPELEAVKAAIFVEEVFGITLTEPEIDPAVLATRAGVRELVLRRQGSRGEG